MKWETYKKMNKKQKEEWEFKYANNKTEIWAIVVVVFFLWLMFLVSSCILLLLVDKPGLIDLQGTIVDFYETSYRITLWGGFFIILYGLLDSIFYFIIRYKEIKWLKSEGLT